MKVLLKWINEYVKIDDLPVDFIAEKLLNIGLEVEGIVRLGRGLDNVVAGRITNITKHIASEKLQICNVDIGQKKPVILVTGAKNIHLNMMAPVALKGAKLPCGKSISFEDFKGIISEGMLCSGKELDITDDIIDGAEIDGILPLPSSTKIGSDICKVLGLDDMVLDISITANRPDCQSVYGIARELSVVLDRKLKPLDLDYSSIPLDEETKKDVPKIKVESIESCQLYQGSYIKDVRVENSPLWMRRRLSIMGMRPINNIVDITNYVLLEVGQPMHAFDRKNIHKNIIIRFASDGEKITALDEKEYTLSSKNLVIADDERALVIAGVMGGLESGINDSTQTVFLESATFARGGVRSTSRSLGLASDSSKRYEKGVNLWSVDVGRRRALALINKLNAGRVVDVLSVDGKDNGVMPQRRKIDVDLKSVDGVLGIRVERSFIKKTLKNLDFEIEESTGASSKDKSKLSVKIPLFRDDVDNFTDLAEEIIRFYGYDKLTESSVDRLPTTIGGISKRRLAIEKIETICNSFGAFEVKNFSFIPERACDLLNIGNDNLLRGHIKILNPLNEDYAVMRTQLVFSVLKNIELNISRQNNDFRIYEIDNSFIPIKDDLPIEQKTLCAAFVGESENFYKIKELAEILMSAFNIEYSIERSDEKWLHPGISADIICGDKVGSLGKIHPIVAENFNVNENIYLLHLDIELLINAQERNIKVKPLPKFPFVERDLSVLIDEKVTVGQLKDEIKSSSEIITNIILVDIYRGEQIPQGKKSVSLRLTLQSEIKTLVDKEINETTDRAIDIVKNKFGGNLRE